MGGQSKSEASSLSSPEVRALWEEPTEAIPQNQRDQAVGIRSLKGVEDVNIQKGGQHQPPSWCTWYLLVRLVPLGIPWNRFS